MAQLDMKESDGSQDFRLAIAHVGRVKKLAKAILNKTFSTHIHRSAFDGIDFGANPHGILGATTDDHLHSCEAGIMMNLAEVAYHGLTAKELTETFLQGHRRLLSKEWPSWCSHSMCN
jgi:hypothetical protein